MLAPHRGLSTSASQSTPAALQPSMPLSRTLSACSAASIALKGSAPRRAHFRFQPSESNAAFNGAFSQLNRCA